MNIDLELLRVFKCVAYHNNISKAANELCITQPSVSKAIKQLEAKLNLTLFVRENRGMKLTDDGKTLYRYIFDSINTLNNVSLIANNINELETGELKIGASISIVKNLLLPTIIDFKKLYPHLGMIVHNSKSEHLYDDLRYGRLDMIFVNSTFNFNRKKYPNFELTEIEDIFFTSKEYYEKIKNINNLEKIISNNLICQRNNFDTRALLDRICNKQNLELKPLIEVDRHDLIIQFVLNGLGIGFATKQYLLDYLNSGTLIEIKSNIKIEKRKVICIYRNNNSEKVKKFLKLLKNIYK